MFPKWLKQKKADKSNNLVMFAVSDSTARPRSKVHHCNEKRSEDPVLKAEINQTLFVEKMAGKNANKAWRSKQDTKPEAVLFFLRMLNAYLSQNVMKHYIE